MTLHAFSRSIHEMYELAEQAAPHVFRQEMGRIVRRHIAFDDAVLGTNLPKRPQPSGRTGSGLRFAEDSARRASQQSDSQLSYLRFSDSKLSDSQVCDYQLADSQLAYTHAIGKSDLEREISRSLAQVSRLCEQGMSRPLAMDHALLFADQIKAEALAAELACARKILVYGDQPSAAACTRWVVLYRDGNQDFDDTEAGFLEALWRHVTNTISMNLNRALDRIDTQQAGRAMALVNERGIIEVANPLMMNLLQVEWMSGEVRSLPLPVISSLLNNGTYRGRQIEMLALQKFGYLACIARKVPLAAALTPSERNVADHFAKGLSHSQIAAILRVSPHTVRNQLAQVYLKLHVHNKVELARAMSSN